MASCLAAATKHRGPKDLADVHAVRLPIYFMPKFFLLNGFVISFSFCTFLQLKCYVLYLSCKVFFVGAVSGVPNGGGGVPSLFLPKSSLVWGLWRSCSVTGFISRDHMQ